MKFSIFGVMFLIMFTLKLAGPMASVSWWLITLPLYGPLLLAAVFAALSFFAYMGLKGK